MNVAKQIRAARERGYRDATLGKPPLTDLSERKRTAYMDGYQSQKRESRQVTATVRRIR